MHSCSHKFSFGCLILEHTTVGCKLKQRCEEKDCSLYCQIVWSFCLQTQSMVLQIDWWSEPKLKSVLSHVNKRWRFFPCSYLTLDARIWMCHCRTAIIDLLQTYTWLNPWTIVFLQVTPKLSLPLQLKIHAFLLWLSVSFLMHVSVLLISSKTVIT